MSDTTAYLAGCATTGVAALVLLVARVGMVSANAESDSARRLDARIERIEAATPNQQTLAQAQSEQALDAEMREELEKQRELTKQLEAQLSEQESLSEDLETQIEEQEEKTKDLLARLQNYQRAAKLGKLRVLKSEQHVLPQDERPRRCYLPAPYLLRR
ncbi:MAG: hypothetical protein AAFY72_17535, partial [Cyanobacteria bacterium J06649_4]